ncbi:MAG: hypothetical protein ACK46X_10655 [Candidatus Sericytochromatia bacterium]
MTTLVWRLTVACALAMPVAACAPHAAVGPSPESAGVTPGRTAAVTIRLGGAFPSAKAPANRATLAYGANETGFAQLDIVKARLKVSGPGLATTTLAEVAWAPEGGASGMPASLRADVSVGPNRIFTVEGLNADGQVVMRLRGAATVAPSGDTPVTINFLSDATARVLEAMLKEAPATTLLDVDRTAAIQQFLADLCRFDAANNTYDGTRLPPQELLVKRLATRLLAAPTNYEGADDPVAAFFEDNPVNTESDSTFVQSMKGGHCAAIRSRIQFYVAGTGGGPVITGLHFLPYPGQHFSQFRIILVVPQNGAWQYIPLETTGATQFGELTLPALPPGVFSVALIRKAVGETPDEFISLTSFDTHEATPDNCPG